MASHWNRSGAPITARRKYRRRATRRRPEREPQVPDATSSSARCYPWARNERPGGHAITENPRPFGAREISFGRAIAEIPGHYRVALELYQRGDIHGALIHAKHPMIEVLPHLHKELREDVTLAASISRALAAAASAVREERGVAEINKAFETVNELGRDAILAIAGDAAVLPDYNASIVAALLDSARHEYSEALRLEGVLMPPEFQDAYGFVRQAARMFEGFKAHVDDEARERIDALFGELTTVLGSVEPPAELPGLGSIEGPVDAIRRELQQWAGALLETEPTPADRISLIKELLRDSARSHRAGNKHRAMDAAARAFIHHYDPIADDVRATAPDRARAIEERFGAELRRAIHRDAPPDEIDAIVDGIADLLDAVVTDLAGASEHPS